VRPHCGLRTGAQQASGPPSALGHVGERSEPTRALPVAPTRITSETSMLASSGPHCGPRRRVLCAETGAAGCRAKAEEKATTPARPLFGVARVFYKFL